MMQSLVFFLQEAWIGVKRSPLMSIVSVVTVSTCMLLLGLFLLTQLNLHYLAQQLTGQLEIRVFLDDNLSQIQEQQVMQRIGKLDWVQEIRFVDKSESWEKFQETFPHLSLLDYEENPLPSSIQIHRKPKTEINEAVTQIKEWEGVEHVNFGGDLANRVQQISQLIQVGGGGLVILLGLATVMIMMNTIRLTVIAREEEIRIMHLVGAEDPFIRWPFLIEGAGIGCFGAIVSILCLQGLTELIQQQFLETMPFVPIILSGSLVLLLYLGIIIAGVTVGVLGAYLSVSRTLTRSVLPS